MATVLRFMDGTTPIYHVLAVAPEGGTIIVSPLWGDAKTRAIVAVMDKESAKKIGYRPMEIDDAQLPQLVC